MSRSEYLQLGLALGVLKYLTEFTAIILLTGQWFSPIDFVNPWLSSKAPFLVDAPGFAAAWFAFTLPFVVVAVTMTMRRAADAGFSPWWGLSMLVPLVNLLMMAVWSLAPRENKAATQESQRRAEQVASAFRPLPISEDDSTASQFGTSQATWQDNFLAIIAGSLTLLTMGGLSVWVFEEYGFVLFFSSPVFAGAVAGYLCSRKHRRRMGAVFGVIAATNVVSFTGMLLIGIDGAICLLMAIPLILPISFVGGLCGAAIATASLRPGRDEHRGMYGALIFLPLALLIERFDKDATLHAVHTSVEIDAPPPVVWKNVISFPRIDAPLPWYHRLGIAAPISAHIEGHGVGATRYCRFTTGDFVEPITRWQPPNNDTKTGRLAFDVVKSPLPMEEWTPIPGLHPPHLDNGLISRHGQFLIEPIQKNRTRLTGTTWYTIDVRPRLYWQVWTDQIIHAIHRRVLGHIKNVSESPAGLRSNGKWDSFSHSPSVR